MTSSGFNRWLIPVGADPNVCVWREMLLFEASLFLVFTMYGGGFATIPAFLADIFGPENVGAIHGAEEIR